MGAVPDHALAAAPPPRLRVAERSRPPPRRGEAAGEPLAGGVASARRAGARVRDALAGCTAGVCATGGRRRRRGVLQTNGRTAGMASSEHSHRICMVARAVGSSKH